MRRGICHLCIMNDKTLDLGTNKLNCVALADDCFNVSINYSF